ncbi:hypothetical protein [Candidatus Harpocratesius sp.]
MDLIIFYLEKYKKGLFAKNYIYFQYKQCHIFTVHRFLDEINSELQEFNRKSKFNVLIFNKNSKKENIDRKQIKNPEIIFTIHSVIFQPDLSLINDIKNILDKYLEINSKKKLNPQEISQIIVDFSNMPLTVGYDYYFLFLKYIHVDNLDIKIITWKPNSKKPYSFSVDFLDPAGQIILDLISTGYHTIQSLQIGYSKYKNLNKEVSQPFISKNISNLIKKNLIEETWINGLKNFTITSNGQLLVHSESFIKNQIQDEKFFKFFNEVSTDELINNAIISYKNGNFGQYQTILEKLAERKDLSESNLLKLIKEINDFKNEDLMVFLEKIMPLFIKSDTLLMKLVQFYISQNKNEKIMPILKKVMQINPENLEAWKLLGKKISSN